MIPILKNFILGVYVTFTDFSIPYALVTTVFPGASQQDVDEFVSVPILDTLSEIEGIETTLPFGSFVMDHQAFISGNFDTSILTLATKEHLCKNFHKF